MLLSDTNLASTPIAYFAVNYCLIQIGGCSSGSYCAVISFVKLLVIDPRCLWLRYDAYLVQIRWRICPWLLMNLFILVSYSRTVSNMATAILTEAAIPTKVASSWIDRISALAPSSLHPVLESTGHKVSAATRLREPTIPMRAPTHYVPRWI